MARAVVTHYGTNDGPACGAHFTHEGITCPWERERVTCERCRRTAAYRANMAARRAAKACLVRVAAGIRAAEERRAERPYCDKCGAFTYDLYRTDGRALCGECISGNQ